VPVALIVVMRYFAVRGDWHLPRTLGSSGADSGDHSGRES
jgi:hypothetical protein